MNHVIKKMMLAKQRTQAVALSSVFILQAAMQITMQTALAPAAVAQAPAAAPAASGGDTGAIDIQAHEQEFTGDHVIAKGNVKVLYKDTIILAPLATLYRDLASGQPQKAIFTGHPHLVQGSNKIDADQLIFEMTTSKIFADGHAHSEIENNDPVAESPVADKKKGGAASKGGGMPPSAGMVSNGKGGFDWPTEEGDRKKAQAAKKEQVAQDKADKDAAAKAASEKKAAEKLASEESGDQSEDGSGTGSGAGSGAVKSGSAAGATKTAAAGGGATADEAPTKIITDADRQEYDRDSGRFEAFGNVKVLAGDIHVTADHLKLAYGLDHKPEAAIFNGHVDALQGKNDTASDFMTYFLQTKRLQASGHVRSKVIQEKAEPKPVEPKSEEGVIKPISNVVKPEATKDSHGKTHSVGPVISLGGIGEGGSKAPIIIISDSQDYNKETGRLDAIGNARIFFEDTIGIGPKVILMKNADGQAEKIIFVGRSQVTQKGKRWIGDRVTILVADRRVLAEGNTKAIILQKKEPEATPLTPLHAPVVVKATTVKPADPKADNKADSKPKTQMAGKDNKLSTSKVDRPE